MTKQDNIQYCAGLRLSNAAAPLGEETLNPEAEIKIGANVHQENFDARAELRQTSTDIHSLNITNWNLQTLVVGAKFGDNRIEAGMDSKVPVSKSNAEKRGIGAFDDAKMGTGNTINKYNDSSMTHWYVNLQGIPYLPFGGSLTVVKPDGAGAKTEYFINADLDSELNLLGEMAKVSTSVVVRSTPALTTGGTKIGFQSDLSAYGLDFSIGYELGGDFPAFNIEKDLVKDLRAGYYQDLGDDKRREFHIKYDINESVIVNASVKNDTNGTNIKTVMDFDIKC